MSVKKTTNTEENCGEDALRREYHKERLEPRWYERTHAAEVWGVHMPGDHGLKDQQQ